MKREELFKNCFWLVARLFVGALFAYAGFMKLTEPIGNFELSLANYPLLPESLIPLIAAVVPWCEWIFGMFLILGYVPRLSSLVICGFLVTFLLMLATGPLFGSVQVEDCGCFGQGGLKLTPKSAFFIDLTALIVGINLIIRKQFPLSLYQWLQSKSS